MLDVFPREKSGQVYRFHYVSKSAGMLKAKKKGDYFKQNQSCPFSYEVSFMAVIQSIAATMTE